ncbi:MAG: hypothetical protein GEV06_28585, partial [Luteitalea sp.]|nr:hypothetical protein [Luteitalea sp.]
MRRTHFPGRPGRVPTSLRVGGLVLVLFAGLSTILGALPVGGRAYFGFFENLTIGGSPVQSPANNPFQQVILPATGGSQASIPTSWHPFSPNPVLPVLLNAEDGRTTITGDTTTNEVLAVAEALEPFALFPYPTTSSNTQGFFSATGLRLEGRLDEGGFRSILVLPGVVSTWFPGVFDPVLFAQAPPNVQFE